MTRRVSVISYGLVALVAAALSSAVTWGAMNASGSAFAQTPPPAGTIPLLT